MGATNPLEQYTKPLREQSLQEQEKIHGAADFLWKRISTSLQAIANQLREWGYLMKSTAQEPDQTMVKNTANAIDDLERSLRELDRWLGHCRHDRWKQLKAILQNKVHKFWHRGGAAAKLSSYRKWYDQQTLPLKDEPEKRAAQRMEVGAALIELSDNIQDALQIAVRYKF